MQRFYGYRSDRQRTYENKISDSIYPTGFASAEAYDIAIDRLFDAMEPLNIVWSTNLT